MNTPSVLLPVYNAQENLEAGVSEILEVLAEIAGRFELTILDDGSTDETAEVAHELAARYPQLRVIRHPVRLGLAEAIQTGLDHTRGEIVLVGDEDYCLEPDDLRTLWQMRDAQWRLDRDRELPRFVGQTWVEKLLAWRPHAAGSRRGFQVILRRVFEQVRMQQLAAMIDGPETPQPNLATMLACRLGSRKHLKMAGYFASNN